MPYVVTQPCCADASCALACPVNAIHPTPDEPGFGLSEMVYIDPVTCVGCGACATACPVDAVVPHTKLSDDQLPFLQINADYYKQNPHPGRDPMLVIPPPREVPIDGLRVAVVGAGPAGLYAADELLKHRGVKVDVFDRLPVPHGLARFGVAPDHRHTKQILNLFRAIELEAGFRYRLNVEVGSDVTLAELRAGYHAVIYAVGAATDRRLGVEGEDLAGSASATDFVAWYNGHPDHADREFPLNSERAVVIGNGNVALDVARILTADPEALAATDISDVALQALRHSAIREVVVLGRRGAADAAFTLPELVGLAGIEDLDVVVEGEVDAEASPILAEIAERPPRPGKRRIVLRFNTAPVRIVGANAVEGVEVTGGSVISAGLVLRAIGYRAHPVKDLPFDNERAVVPNDRGRVEPGVYVAGWIKRGPTGFLGTNKVCAQETVTSLLDDAEDGLLTAPLSQEGRGRSGPVWSRDRDQRRSASLSSTARPKAHQRAGR